MPIKSVLDFPNEIKKIVELFYAGSSKAAFDEAYRIQDKRPDLGLFIECTLRLFQGAPTTAEAFNNSLLLAYQTACSPEPGFESYDEFMNLASSSQNRSQGHISNDDMRFHAELAQSLAAETKLPSILSDASSSRSRNQSSNIDLSSSERSQRATDKLGQDIDIAIDIDFDISQEAEPSPSMAKMQQRNNHNVDEAYRRLQAAKNYSTPPPRSPVSTSQSVPSIMRAAQASEGRTSPSESKLGRRRAQTGNGFDLMLSPFDDTKKRQVLDPNQRRRSHPFNDMPTTDQLTAVNGVTQINLQQINASNKRQKIDTLRDIDVDVVMEKASTAALKPLNRIPVLRLTRDDLSKRRDIDAKAGYILSLIDGETSLLDIIDLSNWSAGETSDILAHLLAQTVIGFRA